MKVAVAKNRVSAIDAARGTAMLFVFLSHFADVYFRTTGQYALMAWSYRISMVASPTFMLVSGIMLGFLYETHRANFAPVARKLFRRGLYLLTLGHLLIGIAHIAYAGSVVSVLRWGFITDTIGVCMILGPLIIRRFRARERLAGGLLLYALSSSVAILWQPSGGFLRVVKEMLFGQEYGVGAFSEFFSLVPWFSVYLLGSVLGEKIGLFHRERDNAAIEGMLFRVGATALLCGILFAAVYKVVAPSWVDFQWLTSALLSPMQKRPPMPAYLLVYGGAGLLILYSLYKFEGRNILVHAYTRVARMSGRTSLFIFIVQYFVYYTFFSLAQFPYSVFWPLYLVLSVAVILALARMWDQWRWTLVWPGVPAGSTAH